MRDGLLLPGEDPVAHETLIDGASWNPATPVERDLVDILIRTTWVRRRPNRGPRQTVIPGCRQSLVLLPPNLIHGITQMFGHLKIVESDLAFGFRHVLPHRGDVRVPPVRVNRPDALD